MSQRLIAAAVLAALAACTATTKDERASARTSETSSPAAPRASGATNANDDEPSVLKPAVEETPAAVRAIEAEIDRRAVVIADDILIEVSKNYEWDVALTGDAVSPQRPNGGGQVSEALGSARATLRNMELRATKRITFWRSGLDVKPFIRVTAKGNVSHVSHDETSGTPRIRRAGLFALRDAALYFDDELLRAGLPIPVAAFER
jgi:hypothetical protein